MSRKSSALHEFKVDQIIGSFAIEGIRTSKEERLRMLSVVNGTANYDSLRDSIIKKYSGSVASK